MYVRLDLTSTNPMLQHNVRLASPLNEYARQIKTLSSKHTKTDDDRFEMARLEWEGGMYFDPDTGPYLPCQNVYKALIEAARMNKRGKKIERGVVITEMSAPLDYDGPRDLESLWGNGKSEFVDQRPVGVQRNTVDRTRPKFPEWRATTRWLLDPALIDLEDFADIADIAGRIFGVGDYRLLYGRFTAVAKQEK